MCTGRSLSTKDLVIKTVHWRDNNGSHSAHEKLLGTEHPYDKAHRLKVECTDGITLTGKFVTVVGALDNEPEIAELIIRRDDNGVLTGVLETEIKTVELMD